MCDRLSDSSAAGFCFFLAPPMGQGHAASLPRVPGPPEEQRHNMDVGARRHTAGLN